VFKVTGEVLLFNPPAVNLSKTLPVIFAADRAARRKAGFSARESLRTDRENPERPQRDSVSAARWDNACLFRSLSWANCKACRHIAARLGHVSSSRLTFFARTPRMYSKLLRWSASCLVAFNSLRSSRRRQSNGRETMNNHWRECGQFMGWRPAGLLLPEIQPKTVSRGTDATFRRGGACQWSTLSGDARELRRQGPE
jgi:hypothetical protein